jgi:hypothetical protein
MGTLIKQNQTEELDKVKKTNKWKKSASRLVEQVIH